MFWRKNSIEPYRNKPISVSVAPVDVASPAYVLRFKAAALDFVARINQGRNVDYDTIRQQLLFAQGQLLDSIMHDPSIPKASKDVVLNYHAKCIRELNGDRRGALRRQVATA